MSAMSMSMLNISVIHKPSNVGDETFGATEFNEIFSGSQPCRGMEVPQRFRD
jgi:hypothetical protein